MDDLGDVRLWDAAQERYAPAVTGRGLRIDVEKARGVVRELESLADAVAGTRRAFQFIDIVPPPSDAVSRNIALQGTRMIFASRAFLASWHDDLVSAIDALKAQISGYDDVDHTNARRA
jgi:hypothetical protein